MTVATFFTLLRIALIPLFGFLWATGHHGEALAIFVIASVSDVLDGFFARWLDQKSRLGAILDPAADKLMLLVSFLVAASVGAVPWWLAGIVIGRDVVLTGGAALIAFVVHLPFDPNKFHPTRIGKYSTFLQLGTIGLALVATALHAQAPRPWVAALVYATCLFTLTSGAQYFGTAVLALREAASSPPALPRSSPNPRSAA